jgi:uracil-DNA glycosylase family 4
MHTSPPFDMNAFSDLIGRAQSCELCPEMHGCNRVLSDANGPGSARIMFIGEAPGRLGAERTAIPFHGDVAGENFERLLSLAGLRRSEVFVTNSILCNPTDAKGNNAPPSRQSIKNCSTLLADQISVIDPAIIVTLGAAALSALTLIEAHDFTLSKDVRSARVWNGRKLIPLYHPGARAMIHRNFATQTADYYFVGETFRRLSANPRRPTSSPARREGWKVVGYVLSNLKEMSLFRLHKIMYLLDYKSLEMGSERVTDFFYIRQKDGPYCVELGTKWYKKFDELNVSFKSGAPVLNWRDAGFFSMEIEIPVQQRKVVDDLLETLSGLSDRQLKTRAYLTRPMKRALRAERSGLVGLNRALLQP